MRSSSPITVGFLALAAAAASPAVAGARLEVSGSARSEAGTLTVAVSVRNAGDAGAGNLRVEGELMGVEDVSVLPASVAPGDSVEVALSFAPQAPPPPGTHALLLRLEYEDAVSATDLEQRAYLLVAVGEPAPEAVSLVAAPAALEFSTLARLELASLDGRPHRVRLRVAVPRGLRVLELPAEADVPAQGAREIAYRLLRAGAPRDTEQGLVAVAETVESPVSASAATGTATILPDSARLPRWRPVLVALALALLVAALVVELRRFRTPPP